MTEEAKTVFANAVAYISKFKGQGIIARKYDERQTTLEYLKEMAYYSTDECYDESLKSNEEWNRQMLETQKEAASKKSKGEPLSQYEEIALNYKPQPQPTREEFFKRHMKEWYDRFGADPEAFRKYLEDNRPYLYGGEGFYTIQLDEDCKRLGIGNHDLKLLDACISMLEKGQDVATARRLLARYTLCDFSSAAEWRTWFSKYKDKLFFSESADWVWLVDSREPGVNDYQGWMRRKTLDKVPAGETSDAAPSREFTEAGDQLLIMRVKIHPGYHIYAYVPENEAFNETEVSFSLPEGYIAAGALQKPFGKPFTGKIRVYEDEVTFIQPISGASKQPVKCEITYQCCDSQICFPPETKTIDVK